MITLELAGGCAGRKATAHGCVVVSGEEVETVIAGGGWRGGVAGTGTALSRNRGTDAGGPVVLLASTRLVEQRRRGALQLRLARNVRELQRVIERAVALAASDVVTLTDLPIEVSREYTEILQPSISAADSMRAWGSRYARLILERCNRNKRRACEVLGISYHTLQ